MWISPPATGWCIVNLFKHFNITKQAIMQRRAFIKNSALGAVALSAYGFIQFDGRNYIGDCETTTDILGPFYRPGGPVKNNLALKDEPGNPIELSGTIRHKDCKTPYQKATIELWHCDAKGVYDNNSAEFRYRGTTYSDDNGNYTFNTILPVAYDAGGGHVRPAHFHLMITAEGYQPLVTQLYFSGDTHIKNDHYASSQKAKSRILNVQKLSNGTHKVVYNVSMAEVLHLEAEAVEKLTGVYTNISNKNKPVELFSKNNVLWMKNEAFGNKFEYTGNNTFEEANNPPGIYWKLHFELMESGAVKLTENYIDDDLVKHAATYLKEK
jgi:catechol 1,2-dioxygenase